MTPPSLIRPVNVPPSKLHVGEKTTIEGGNVAVYKYPRGHFEIVCDGVTMTFQKRRERTWEQGRTRTKRYFSAFTAAGYKSFPTMRACIAAVLEEVQARAAARRLRGHEA